MTDIMTVLTTLRDDPDLLRQFTEDPEGVVTQLGVNTADVSIQRIPGGNAPFENFRQAVDNLETQEAMPLTICASAGVGVCVSVGG
jgi:hypothetical protein